MQKLAFSAHISTKEYITLTKGSILVFNKVICNLGDGFDVNTGSFRTKIHGIYHLILNVMKSNTGGGDLGIFKNGDCICTAQFARPKDAASCAVMIELDIDDIVNVRAVTVVSLQPNDGNIDNHHAFVGFLYVTL